MPVVFSSNGLAQYGPGGTYGPITGYVGPGWYNVTDNYSQGEFGNEYSGTDFSLVGLYTPPAAPAAAATPTAGTGSGGTAPVVSATGATGKASTRKYGEAGPFGDYGYRFSQDDVTALGLYDPNQTRTESDGYSYAAPGLIPGAADNLYYEPTTNSYYSAIDYDAADRIAGGQPVFYNAPETGSFMASPGEGGRVEWTPFSQEVTSQDEFGNTTNNPQGNVWGTRDQVLEKLLANTGVAPEQFKAVLAQRGVDPYSVLNAGVAPQYTIGKWAEFRDTPGGASVNARNPYGPMMAMLQSAGIDWRNDPQLSAMFAAGQEAAGKQADAQQSQQQKYGGNFLMNVALPGLMTFAPALGAGLGNLGSMAAGQFAAGAVAPLAANVAAQAPLMALGSRALGIIDPQLAQVAGLANFAGGMLGLGGGAAPYGMPSGADWSLIEGGAGTNFVDTNFANTFAPPTMPAVGLPMPTVDELVQFGGEDALSQYVLGDDAARQALIEQVQASPEFLASIGPAAASGIGAPSAPGTEAPTAPGTEAPTGPQQQQPGALDKLLRNPQQLFSVARTVFALTQGDDDHGASAPQRRAGQTDASYRREYANWAVDYLGLDAETMAKAGLEAGSPEYMQYILNQANSIIEQIFSRAPEALRGGESVEDLQSALGDMTKREMSQLSRALYVRGALGQLMGAGDYADPFTGLTESTVGGMLSPSTAAYQRGIARSADELAGLRGGEARSYLDMLLGRRADLFGLNAMGRANQLRAQLVAAQLENENLSDEERRRLLSMLGGAGGAADWAGVLNTADDRFVNQLQGDQGALDLYNAIFGGQ